MTQDSITTTRPIPFKDDVLILASLDGLVCIALWKTRELAFWNPVTGAYNKFHTNFYGDMFNGAFALYIDSSNDYKLVHIVSEGAFIYSRRLDSWRKIINPSLDISKHILNFDWSLATFFEGKVYFKLQCKRTRHLRCLMSFDVESEKFKEIQFLPVPCDQHFRVSLVALNGCIQLCVAYGYNVTSLECGMWRMDGDEWIKVAAFASLLWKPFRKIYTKKNGNWLAIRKDSKCIKNIGLEDFATDFYAYFVRHSMNLYQRVVYIETLVSPNP